MRVVSPDAAIVHPETGEKIAQGVPFEMDDAAVEGARRVGILLVEVSGGAKPTASEESRTRTPKKASSTRASTQAVTTAPATAEVNVPIVVTTTKTDDPDETDED